MSRVEVIKVDIAVMLNATREARTGKAEHKLQEIYDRVLRTGQGKSVDEVKAILRNEIRATFGTDMTDPQLSACAEVLAAGQRLGVRRPSA